MIQEYFDINYKMTCIKRKGLQENTTAKINQTATSFNVVQVLTMVYGQ
jgi:hypothetical protein